MKKFLLVVLVITVLGGAAFFYFNGQAVKAQTSSNYQTQKLVQGDLTATVGATGTVRTNQTTTVNWQIGGRIGKIMVKEGDQVTKDQVLAELDPASLPQNIILAKSDLVTAQRNLDNLQKSGTSRTQAQKALADAQKALQDAKNDRYGKNLARVSKTTIDQKSADLVIAKDRLERAKDTYEKFETKPEDDVNRANAFSALASAQAKVDQINYDLAWLLSLPDTTEVAQADAAVAVAEAKLADAQREWDRLKNGTDPQDILAAQAKVESIQATLAQNQIKAPINGTVTDIKSMIGDQVNAGTISFRIDDLTRYLVDVSITEVDINRIKVGQSVKLTFDAITGKEYQGKVVDVSSFGTSTSGVVNFLVTVELSNPDKDVRAGMTAAVNLTVEQLTNVLLVPNRAVRLQDGKRIVYILEAGQLKTVEITLGASAEQTTQILNGDLKAGDEVVLNPPSVAFSPATPPSGAAAGIFGMGR